MGTLHPEHEFDGQFSINPSSTLLDPEEFRRQGHMMVDFLADYFHNVEKYPVRSQVEPNYLKKLLPDSAPNQSEPIEKILEDVKKDIFPGLTHWQSPNFFAYFPCISSTAGILGEMLSAGLNVVGFSWIASPAATELESIVMDWLGKLICLPKTYLFSGGGGGVIQVVGGIYMIRFAIGAPLTDYGHINMAWDVIQNHANVMFDKILLLNFRKEILPFIPKTQEFPKEEDINDDCSDILVVRDSMAVAAHNEDANVALVGHTYLVKVTLCNGTTFTAYTYAGELPSCAFGFNNHGVAFTLNSVPPCEEEIVGGAIGRNFVSRDLLEASSIEDALARIRSSEVSVGHSYNLIDTRTRRILNIETASRNRISVQEIRETPFFHANMYLHLPVKQAQDKNSLSRQTRASSLAKESKSDFLALLGDMNNEKYPIYMKGPLLYTLCTAVIDLDEKILTIIEGNPKEKLESYVFSLS